MKRFYRNFVLLVVAIPCWFYYASMTFSPLVSTGASLSPSQLAAFFQETETISGVPAPDADILNWPMLDGSGTVLTITGDQTPRGVTDADWVTGLSGSGFALEFNGTDDNLYTSASGTTEAALTYGTNQITLSVWLFLDNTNTLQMITESSSAWFSGDGRYAVYCEAGVINASMRGVGANKYRVETIPAPNTNAVVHLAVTMDNSTAIGDFVFYVNGQTQTETVSTANPAKDAASVFNANTFFSGARNNGSLFFNGKIDDLRIYTGLLSQAQVQAIYAEGSQ